MKYTKIITLFLLIIIAFYPQKTNAQIGGRISYIKPSGDYGLIFKPTLCYELVYYPYTPLEDRIVVGLSIGFMKPQTRLDSIPVYTIQYDGNHTNFLPSYEKYEKYFSVPIALNLEYKFIKKKKFTPVIGLDIYLHLIRYIYINDIATVTHFYDDGGKVAVGLNSRFGFLYQPNKKIMFDCGIGKCGSIEQYYTIQSYWKIYLSSVYYF